MDAIQFDGKDERFVLTDEQKAKMPNFIATSSEGKWTLEPVKSGDLSNWEFTVEIEGRSMTPEQLEKLEAIGGVVILSKE